MLETKTRNGAVRSANSKANASATATAAATRKAPPAVTHLTVAEREAKGIEARKRAARSSHGDWSVSAERPDPIAALVEQCKSRLPDLVPLRFGRMAASPFGFYRGAPLVMAHDLATTPNSGLYVQLCGDAHLVNFGVYGSPERTLVFDINDFDETLPGPWEWDVKRLAASVVVAGRERGFPAGITRGAVVETVMSYRRHMADYAGMGDSDVWYSHITADDILGMAQRGGMRRRTEALFTKARTSGNLKAFSKLTTVVDGKRIIADDPPLVVRLPAEGEEERERLRRLFSSYRRTLQEDVRHLVEQYQFVDVARKVVGVGSVGTRCFIVLAQGRDEDDPMFLQVKEAETSVLSGLLPKSVYHNQGQRVVAGQRLVQMASDILLGWLKTEDGRDAYVRQLRDMKGSVDMTAIRPDGLTKYGGVCGWALANAHARSGDRVAIAAYLGTGGRFDEAIADFAESYANQNERDHAALVAAIKAGRVKAEEG